MNLGVMTIRTLARGALAGNATSPHTFKTPFFPLPLYEPVPATGCPFAQSTGPQSASAAKAIRFMAHPQVSSAIVGFGETWQINEAIEALESNASALNWDDVFALEPNI